MMKQLLPIIAAAALVAPAPAFAISAGVVNQNGNRIRMLVQSAEPVDVQMFSINEKGETLEGTEVFPEQFVVSGTRRVYLRVPNDTWAVCARVIDPFKLKGKGTQFEVQSCAWVNTEWVNNSQSIKLDNKSRTGRSIQHILGK